MDPRDRRSRAGLGWGRLLTVFAMAAVAVAGYYGVRGYNPVRAEVEDANVGYGGKQKSTSLAAVPAVDYTNRYAIPDHVNGMRFAGSSPSRSITTSTIPT